jgi:hypothetical protein
MRVFVSPLANSVIWKRSSQRVRLGLNAKEAVVKRIKLGTNFTVFLLFFGVAALEAIQTRNWLKAALWLAIGVVFLLADNLKDTVDG